MTHKVTWIDGKREPKCAPAPRYPAGIDVDLAGDAAFACQIALPYPAKRCGLYAIRCKSCGLSAIVTMAGRPDDPHSVKLGCKLS